MVAFVVLTTYNMIVCFVIVIKLMLIARQVVSFILQQSNDWLVYCLKERYF